MTQITLPLELLLSGVAGLLAFGGGGVHWRHPPAAQWASDMNATELLVQWMVD